MTEYRLVPVPPTDAMLEAGHYAMVAGCYPSGVYTDMVMASPVVQMEAVGWQYRIKTTTTGSMWSAWVECSREEYEYATENPGPCERGITRESRELYAAPIVQGEPVEFDYPDFHELGMGCGLEDRNITDRYEAMRYGWDKALDRVAEIIDNLGPLYTAPRTAEPLERNHEKS